ncbi:MAG: ankyrin repeat domain-containing protein [Myxococcales bacterium]|nr:ankyrin repeat domain-containing protein [Myxococcales bacterium]
MEDIFINRESWLIRTMPHLSPAELEALDVELASASDDEVGKALVGSVRWNSFNAQARLTKRLVPRASQTHRNEALAQVAYALLRSPALVYGEHFDVLDTLLAAGAQPDWSSAEIPTPALHALACKYSSTSLSAPRKALLKKYAKLTARADAVFALALQKCRQLDFADVNGWTALHHAVLNSQITRVEQLVAAGANRALKTNQGLDAVALAHQSPSAALTAVLAALGK